MPFVLEVMADLQPYCFEPECVPNPDDMRKRKRRSERQMQAHFGVLVSDVKSCQRLRQRKEFVTENGQRQKPK